MEIDWQAIDRLISADSKRLLQLFTSEMSSKGVPLDAIGFAFEFGRRSLQFDICANTVANARSPVAERRQRDEQFDEWLWNSGDFDFPGAIAETFGGFSAACWQELQMLEQIANQGETARSFISSGITEICCHVLAECSIAGVFSQYPDIKYNVGDLLEEPALIRQRHDVIKSLIERAS
ncbi:MAG: hypothetical protein AAF456_18075 [Planctomycetota bacterium]